MSVSELRDRMRGVLGFPITPFRRDLSVDLDGQTYAQLYQKSTMWLMFKPYLGEWVPLRKVDWTCGASASLTNSNWIITNPYVIPNPQDSDAIANYPTWADNYANTNSFNWNPPLP